MTTSAGDRRGTGEHFPAYAGRQAAHDVSRTWVQAAALVILFGFTVLGFLAFRIVPLPMDLITPFRGTSGHPDGTSAGQELDLSKLGNALRGLLKDSGVG